MTQEVPPQESIYQAAEDFDGLGLKQQLLQDLYTNGFDKPSKIQLDAIGAILKEPRKSVLAQSQNGTGKTLAYIVGVLQRIDENNPSLQAVCLFPTRELVNQTYENYVQKLTASLQIKTSVLIKNPPVSLEPERAQLILSTPAQFDKKYDDLTINTVRIIAIDEADQVLSQKTFSPFFDRLFPRLTKNTAQILLFTATLTDRLFHFVNFHIKEENLEKITSEEGKEFNPTNSHYNKWCNNQKEKEDLLKTIFKLFNASSVFIFVKTKAYADDLTNIIKQEGYKPQEFSSKLTPIQRDQVMKQFRDGTIHVLITTDVLARGVDIPTAKIVINFDMPEDFETYMHRQGRTGRWGRRGVVINFLSNEADVKEHDQKLLNEIKRHQVDLFDYNENAIKQILS